MKNKNIGYHKENKYSFVTFLIEVFSAIAIFALVVVIIETIMK